jgi:hypothetical protein
VVEDGAFAYRPEALAKKKCPRRTLHTHQREYASYEVTIDDPKVYTRWKMRMPLYRRMDKDPQVLEYNCVCRGAHVRACSQGANPRAKEKKRTKR